MQRQHVHRQAPDPALVLTAPLLAVLFQLTAWVVFGLPAAERSTELRGKLPPAMPHTRLPEGGRPLLRIRLQADATGQLTRTSVAGHEVATGFDALPTAVFRAIQNAGWETAEVELDCDYHLRYEYVVQCLDAVCRTTDARGTPVQLIQRVRFSPAVREPPAAPQ